MLFFRLALSLFIVAFSAHSKSINVVIHTNNLTDYHALADNNGEDNFTVSSNLIALSKLHAVIQFEYMTTKRSLRFMNKGESICIVNRIKTKERSENYLFSQPVNMFLGRRLYSKVSHNNAQKTAGPNDVLSLTEVFTKEPEEKILVTDQISYGDTLDDQLHNIPMKNKVIRSAQGHASGLIDMFIKDRAKYALFYPQQVFEFMPNLEVNSYKVEGTTSFVLGRFMCTKSSESVAFIEEVNKQLSKSESISALEEVHLKFVKPNDKLMLEHYFRQVF